MKRKIPTPHPYFGFIRESTIDRSPIGPELGPFLKALTWMFIEPEALPPHPGLTDRVFPAELKLYIAEQCPFCPAVVEKLVPLAIASPRVRLTVIDAGLCMEEARRDRVQSVPTLMLDSHFRWSGTIPIREVVTGGQVNILMMRILSPNDVISINITTDLLIILNN